ncbi:MAG TPA: adenylate/guanylate cyclase domain-containing protein [Dehalococcoidia bacterium]|nr:adenylate/guanylate cyclase domain-containing protein [Dehalococcoidia bacterium]
MEADARFCTTSDGVRIAYTVAGDGPCIVCCPDAVGSFALDHLIEDQMGFWRLLWHGRRVVRYDMRGTGLSQRDVADVSHDALVHDLEAVADAADARAFTLWASTLSGPRAIEYAVRNPGRVRRLILHRTFACARDVISEAQVQSFAALARADWRMAAQAFADLPVRRELPDAGVNQAHLYVQSTSGEFVARLLEHGFATFDVTALLPDLQVPTLVLHRRDDPMFPFRVAQDLAGAIPSAHLRPLAQGIMSYLAAGQVRVVVDAINEFIGDGAAAPDAPAPAVRAHGTSTGIILFTDIADSTAVTERMGDAAFRAASRALDARMRGAMRDAGGMPIGGKVLGDGVMAVFASAAEAIVAARACVAAGDEAGLPLHAGLHAGDVLHEDDNVYGGTVNIASRICGLSAPGEILVSGTVRELARTSAGVAFEDRGDHALKGVADAVRLYAVSLRES